MQFHKKDPNLLASGSTDGLINVYNLKESTEDDALLHTYNTESSVDKFSWFTSSDGDGTKKDSIAVKTHDECLSLWKLDDGDAFCKVSREKLSTSLQVTFKRTLRRIYPRPMGLNKYTMSRRPGWGHESSPGVLEFIGPDLYL